MQPFTFGGVARFASAGIVRVFAGALFFATLGAAALGAIAANCWAPAITEAVAGLPATGMIENGQLVWPEKDGRLLAANQFISFEVQPGDPAPAAGATDLGLQFRRTHLLLRSLYGFATVFYPPDWRLPFNRPILMPLWGAWQAPCIAAFMALSGLVLIFNWCALAVLYAIVPLLLGLAANREISFYRAWKLSIAAQWPGSIVMAFSLALYAVGQVSLVFLTAMFAGHFLPTLLYVLVSPFFLPRQGAVRGGDNPFEPAKKKSRGRKNPFEG